jgi:hypothetical protein
MEKLREPIHQPSLKQTAGSVVSRKSAQSALRTARGQADLVTPHHPAMDKRCSPFHRRKRMVGPTAERSCHVERPTASLLTDGGARRAWRWILARTRGAVGYDRWATVLGIGLAEEETRRIRVREGGPPVSTEYLRDDSFLLDRLISSFWIIGSKLNGAKRCNGGLKFQIS